MLAGCASTGPASVSKKKMINTLLATPPFFRIGMGHRKGLLPVSAGMPCDLCMIF